jgi:hypothetical protein
MMHEHYKVNDVVEKMDKETLRKFLDFRIKFLHEELEELGFADNPEDVVDALIDLCVVAIGTLDSFGVNSYTAWDEVLKANMAKKIGVKESRPNPLGLPDLIKPEGWVGPEHGENVGLVSKLFKD